MNNTRLCLEGTHGSDREKNNRWEITVKSEKSYGGEKRLKGNLLQRSSNLVIFNSRIL